MSLRESFKEHFADYLIARVLGGDNNIKTVSPSTKELYLQEVENILLLQHEGHRLFIGKVEGELPDCDTFRWIDLDEGGWKYDKAQMKAHCPVLKANYVQEVKE